jgi:hypothetical protein
MPLIENKNTCNLLDFIPKTVSSVLSKLKMTKNNLFLLPLSGEKKDFDGEDHLKILVISMLYGSTFLVQHH